MSVNKLLLSLFLRNVNVGIAEKMHMASASRSCYCNGIFITYMDKYPHLIVYLNETKIYSLLCCNIRVDILIFKRCYI